MRLCNRFPIFDAVSLMSTKNVVILFRYIPQYRLPFLQALYNACRERGTDLTVIYGNPAAEDVARADRVEFPSGAFVPNRFFSLGRSPPLIWQPVLSRTVGADLVIV